MTQRNFLKPLEIEKILQSIPKGENSIRDRCMILMCYVHGLRVSELVNLKMQDLELENNKITISRLKNGLSVQHPLQSRERSLLERWLTVRSRYLGADTDTLFLSRQGGQISRQHFHRLTRKYGELAEIEILVHPHMFRHACGYALADKGVDTKLIQDYLGHKNIQHTVIYTSTNVRKFSSIYI